jgi:endonuclease-8
VPEGDTIARLVRRLNPPTAGRTVTSSEVRIGRGAGTSLVGQVLLGWESRGKHILTRFSGGVTLHTHLKMDGRWTLLAAGKALPRRMDPDVRVIMGLGGHPGGGSAGSLGPTLYGISLPIVELVPTREEASVVGHLGPDLLGPGWNEDEAVRRLAAEPDRPIVEALLDQRNLAGIGNVWAVELCFLRGLHPWRPVATVDLPAAVRLARKMLRHSFATTGSHVTTGNTRRGETHWVYGRSGHPCRRCGTTVAHRSPADGNPHSRDTWWCPTCQPA